MAVIAEKNDYLKNLNCASRFKLISSLKFYPQIFNVILKANRKAVKGLYNSEAWINSSTDILQIFENLGVDVQISGMENFTKINEPVVFISNHMSTLETFLFPGIIHPVKKICFIMKKELVEYPLFGAVSGARHPIVVGRKNPREDLVNVLNQGEERIKEGFSIVVFPQKSRNNVLNESQFNSIGLKIAQKNKIPIIPVAVKTDVWGNGKFVRDVGWIDANKPLRIIFGEAIYPQEIDKDTNKKVIEFIRKNFHDWGLEVVD